MMRTLFLFLAVAFPVAVGSLLASIGVWLSGL
jgi:hypothetical protein